MKSFLMSQGQWKCVKKPFQPSPAPKASSSKRSGEDPADVPVPDDDDDKAREAYEELNDKAIGNIRLRLHHTIGYQFNDVDLAHDLWAKLEAQYAKPGFTQLFVEFKGAMNTIIPANADPRPAIDKILTHFTRLRVNDLKIPDNIQSLILLSKAPSTMEVMVQAFSADATQKGITNVQEICHAMISSWQNSGRSGTQGNQQRANKLSAVKSQDDQNPQFQQQQDQQRGDGQWRGRGK